MFFEIFGNFHEDNAIENLFVDTLVQRYMSVESGLWNYIYNSGAKKDDARSKIVYEHNKFLLNGELGDVMNDVYMLKFGKYLNLTAFENYGIKDPMVNFIATQPYGIIGNDAHVKSEIMTNNYNRIISEDIFDVIKRVSVQKYSLKMKYFKMEKLLLYLNNTIKRFACLFFIPFKLIYFIFLFFGKQCLCVNGGK